MTETTKEDKMTENKAHSLHEKISDTMACTAFAEAGEPCPICREQKESVSGVIKTGKTPHEHPILERIENELACTAFAEEGEPCPICQDKKQ